MTRSGDPPIVICGAGVIGAAVAYYLTLRGEQPVIFERDGVASGASGAAAGILTPPSAMAGEVRELAAAGFALHEELAQVLRAESGIDYGYRRTPRLLGVRAPGEVAAARSLARELAEFGERARWLTPGEVLGHTGWVDRLAGGIEVAAVAQLDPYRFTLALLTAAERRGARLRTGEVSGVWLEGERLVGLLIGGERLRARAAVFAAGPWSAAAGAWLGRAIPVEPLKGQIVKVRPAQPLRDFCVSAGGNYAVTKKRGLLYLGTTEERAGFDRSPTPEARVEILAFGLGLSSALEGAELVDQTACLRPLSADGLPIIGPVPGVRGAFVATGHGRQGILMAPATGRAVADLVMNGRTDCFGLEPFLPGRFEGR